MIKEYETNEEFREYVDKYCISNKITVDEALTHAMVKEFYNWLKSR